MKRLSRRKKDAITNVFRKVKVILERATDDGAFSDEICRALLIGAALAAFDDGMTADDLAEEAFESFGIAEAIRNKKETVVAREAPVTGVVN